MNENTGTIFDIRRFSTHDGEGIRTTVFLKGCPLSCVWCHNPEGISTRVRPIYFSNRCIGCGTCCRFAEHGGIVKEGNQIRLDAARKEDWEYIIEECPSGAIRWDSIVMTVSQAAEAVMKDAPFYRNGGGVTLSGGEPLSQPDFLNPFLREMKKRKVHTAIESALYVDTEILEALIPLVDLIYADFKIFDSKTHKKYTGVCNERIKGHIRLLLEGEKRDCVIIRTPMIPGLTTSRENIAGTSSFISGIYKGVFYELLNYNPLAEAKYQLVDKAYCFKNNPQAYSRRELEKKKEIARANGVINVI